jgi:PRTRC genetic system ThiF family protein
MIIASNQLSKSQLDITLVGAGGTGSYLASLLAQMAYTLNKITDGQKSVSIRIIDDDVVSEANIGRANFYPCDLGLLKAEVIADRLRYGLGVDITTCTKKLNPIGYFNRHCDLVVTCVDSAKFRWEFGRANSNATTETLWVDVGNGAHDGQVIVGHLGKPNGEKYPNIYDLYGDIMLDADDDDQPSCSLEEALFRQDLGVNHHAATRAFNAIWSLVRHGKLNYSADYFNFQELTDTRLSANKRVWDTFGFKQAV